MSSRLKREHLILVLDLLPADYNVFTGITL